MTLKVKAPPGGVKVRTRVYVELVLGPGEERFLADHPPELVDALFTAGCTVEVLETPPPGSKKALALAAAAAATAPKAAPKADPKAGDKK